METPLQLDYDTVLKMIDSSDPENKVVVLTMLNNVDFTKEAVKILLLRKKSQASYVEWKAHAPLLVEHFEKIGITFKSMITFEQILKMMQKYKLPSSEVELLVKVVNEEVLKDIKIIGYDYIKAIKVTLEYDE